MTLTTVDFEGANGSPITDGVLQGAGAAVYDTSWAVSGSSSGSFTATTGNARSTRVACTANTVQSFQMFFKMPAWPSTGNIGVGNIRNTTPAVALRAKIDSTGHVGVEAGSTGFSAASAPITAGTPVRLTVLVNVATGATTAKVYTGATYSTLSTSPVTYPVTLTYPSTTAALDTIDIGAVTAAVAPVVVYTVQADYCQMDSGSTTELTVPAAPSVTAVAGVSDQYPAAGTTVTLSSTGSTTTGASYLWAATAWPDQTASPSISNTTAAAPTVTLAAGGRYTFQLTVTVGGTTATSSVTVYVNAPNFGVYSTSGTWTNNGGAATLVAAFNDTLATTYGQTQPAPAGDTETLVMNPAPLGALSIFISAYYVNGPVSSRVVRVYKEDGTTLLYTQAAYAVGSADAEKEIVLDSTALAAIPAKSDRRALVVTITDTV